MGILDDTIEKIKDAKEDLSSFFKPKKSVGNGSTPDDILTDTDELDRLERYIDPKEKTQIIDDRSGLKHGVKKIGTRNDTSRVLGFRPGQLFFGATKRAQRQAAKYYARKHWRENLLNEKIITKSGKDIIGRMISKNIYVKEVSYTRKGKIINYLQARNIKTGRIVGTHAMRTLIGKTLKHKI